MKCKAPRGRSYCSSMRCTLWWVRVKPKARWMLPICLKPALARGELHCVGATTLDEYRKNVEKDAATCPSVSNRYLSANPALKTRYPYCVGIKEKYELHHGVRISDGALVSAANLSNRYITDRFLPDKAIDLMDEASSRIRMQVDSKPEELDELDRAYHSVEKSNAKHCSKKTDKGSAVRLKVLEGELVELQEKADNLTARWEAEKKKTIGRTRYQRSTGQCAWRTGNRPNVSVIWPEPVNCPMAKFRSWKLNWKRMEKF